MVRSNGEYLTFKLDKDSYAIEIARVREVLDYEDPTRVPRSPDFFVGIVNLRGEMLPVLDMRVILGVPDMPVTLESCVIVSDITVEEEQMTVGVLADSVQQVTAIPDADIKAPPKIGANVDVGFLNGIGKIDERFVMILNMDKILSIEELNIVEELSSIVAESFLEVGEQEGGVESTLT